jgi:hypothetical protein
MSQSEPTPDSRQIVEDLENDIVDVEGVRSRDEAQEAGEAGEGAEAADHKEETAAPDGTRTVPGSLEPPD